MRLMFALICSFILAISGSLLVSSVKEHKDMAEKEAVEKKEWVAIGCPVVDSECGSKHKYACYIAVNGNGDFYVAKNILVKSRKTCGN
jgi:hypothetical protein